MGGWAAGRDYDPFEVSNEAFKSCAFTDELEQLPPQQQHCPLTDVAAWRAKGGVPAILTALRENTDDKEEALRSLLTLSEDPGDSQELAQEGTVRELLRLYDFQSQALTEVLPQVVVAVTHHTSNGPSQLVAAFSDENPQVVFGAAALARHLIEDPRVLPRLLDAGIVRGLVRVLYHPSPSCCSAGLLACAAMADLPVLLPRFTTAGVLSAMMYAICEGCTPGDSSDEEEDLSKHVCNLRCPIDDEFDVRMLDSCVIAQSVILSILLSSRALKRRYRRMAKEIVLAADAADAFVRALTMSTGTSGDDGKGIAIFALPAYLLITVIDGLRACNCRGCTNLRCIFIKDMVNEGLLAGVGRLITPHSYTVSNHGFTLLDSLLDSLSVRDLPAGRTRPLAAALARYIEDEAESYEKAGKALGRLCSVCGLPPPFGAHPEKLIRNLIRLMGTVSGAPSALELSYVIGPLLRAADLGPEMIKVTISSGFIQRVLCILSCEHHTKCGVTNFGNPSRLHAAMLDTLYLVILKGADVVMEIALRCDFAVLIKPSLQSTNRLLLLVALTATEKALRTSQGHKLLRQKGVSSRVISTLLKSEDAHVVEAAKKALQALRKGRELESPENEADGKLTAARSRGSKRVMAVAGRHGVQMVSFQTVWMRKSSCFGSHADGVHELVRLW